MELTDKQKRLLELYYQLAGEVNSVTASIMEMEEPEQEKVRMQSHMMAAIMNDFIATLPGITAQYMHQVVDYVFKVRVEANGGFKAPPMPGPAAPSDWN